MVGRLALLQSQFSEIWIHNSVQSELGAHPDPVARGAIQEALGEGWVRCASPVASPLLSLLSLHLHRGEAEAIALAVDLHADVVIIDEQEGREFAAQGGASRYRRPWDPPASQAGGSDFCPQA